MPRFNARLVEAETLCGEARHLVLEALQEKPFEFVAGQYVRVTVGHRGKFEERYYSIASAPADNRRFELCVATGSDSTGEYLARVEPGERFACNGPAGKLAGRHPFRASLLVGHGTGIAPLRAILDAAVANPRTYPEMRIVMLQGARTPDRLFYSKRFSELADARPGFTYLPTVSRPAKEWTARRGRVQLHLEEALAEFKDKPDVYICGSPVMVADVRERLAEAGVPEANVFYEKH